MPLRILFLLVCFTVTARAANDLRKGLDSLNTEPIRQNVVSQESYYFVQPRNLPLVKKKELGVVLGRDLAGNSFLVTQQLGLQFHYHFDDRWSLVADHHLVNNRFSAAADRLQQDSGLVPKVSYATARTHLGVEWNSLYGKFRIGRDRVLYFDQYLGASVSRIALNTGVVNGLLADLGLAFWFAPKWSARIGLKDDYYPEQATFLSNSEHYVQGYLATGMVF